MRLGLIKNPKWPGGLLEGERLPEVRKEVKNGN